MNPTTLIRCVAATLAATTLLLAQSAPLPSRTRPADRAPERASERMQVRLAEVIAMLEEDDLSPEQRVQAKKKLEEIVARLREAQPTPPAPPSPAAAPRSPQPSPRTDVVELSPPAADAPRGRVLRVTGHVDSDPVARVPQDPAPPPAAPKAENPAKAGKPVKPPKPPKPDTTEAPTPFEVTETESRRPVPEEFHRLEMDRAEAQKHADALRAEADKLRAEAERLRAEAHGQSEEARVLRSKVDQERRAADQARGQYERARSTAPEAEAKGDLEEAHRIYTTRAKVDRARDEAVEAEKQAKDNVDRRRTFVVEEGGEQKVFEMRPGAGRAPGRQLETRNEGGETRAVEVAPPRARGHEEGHAGDDAEIRALIDQMRAEMREIRELIQQMRKQTSAAPRNAGSQGMPGLGGGSASGINSFSGSDNTRALGGQDQGAWWTGSGSGTAPKAPTNLKWTTSGKGQASGDASGEGAGTSSNTTTPMRVDYRWAPGTSEGATAPTKVYHLPGSEAMKVDFRTWDAAK